MVNSCKWDAGINQVFDVAITLNLILRASLSRVKGNQSKRMGIKGYEKNLLFSTLYCVGAHPYLLAVYLCMKAQLFPCMFGSGRRDCFLVLDFRSGSGMTRGGPGDGGFAEEGDRKGRPYGRRWVSWGGGQIDCGVIICHFHNSLICLSVTFTSCWPPSGPTMNLSALYPPPFIAFAVGR